MGHMQNVYLALLNGKEVDGGVTIKGFIPEGPQVKHLSRNLPSALNEQFSMALILAWAHRRAYICSPPPPPPIANTS